MSSPKPIKLAVIGAGLIGERHCLLAADHPDFDLSVIVDGNPEKVSLANALGCAFESELEQVESVSAQAAIISTPNGDHLRSGLACLARDWPCLIEKPISDTVADGARLETAFARVGVPLLIGHHRRYHPFVGKARDLIQNQQYGQPVAASIIWAVRKPDDYFRQGAWRLGADGGPLLINLIHELDLILCVLGPVVEVQAMASNHQRGGQVEDTAAILLRHENGMLTTITLTDCGLSPWSFEGACGENPNIAETRISSWRVICTKGSFDFPSLNIWHHEGEGEGDWSKPLATTKIEVPKVKPLHEQLSHFAQLVRGETTIPMVSGHDGLEALRLLEGINTAIASGSSVSMISPDTERAAS